MTYFSLSLPRTSSHTSEIEDCSSIWTFDPNSVDFVHIRWLIGSVGDWDDLFQQAYRILKPGGYVESLEPNINVTSDDGSVREGSVQWQWGRVFAEGGKKLGRSFTVVEDDLQKKGIEAAGFVDIEERMFRVTQDRITPFLFPSHPFSSLHPRLFPIFYLETELTVNVVVFPLSLIHI